MKIKSTTTIIFLFCSFLSLSSLAIPLSGTYTIGGASPDYPSFTAAAAALTTNGVSGRVTFNVRPGVYNEQFTLPAITGSSNLNRITFQAESGVASSVTITYTATGTNDNYVVFVNGTDYITFRNLTISAIGSTYAKAFVIRNNSIYDSVANCILSNSPSSYGVGTSQVVDAYAYNGNQDYFVFSGNQVTGGSFGFQMEGGSAVGLVIENNTWTNNAYMALDLNGCKNAIIRGNIINNPSFGIMIWNGCDGVRIYQNHITAGNGLYIPSAGVVGNEGLIYNNFFYCTTYAIYGINTTNQIFYHNTAVAKNASGSLAVYMYGGCSNNIFRNNIFVNSAGGKVVSISPPAAVSVSDYNDFYTTGASLGEWNGTNCSSLAAWQATSGKDANSRSLAPPFVSSTDLHLTSYSTMNFGTPLNVVPTDIDGDVRSTVNPVVGGDEGNTNPIARFGSADTAACVREQINFTDQSGGSPISWNWTFPGGTPGTSSNQNPSVTYNTPGTYDVKLVVTNSTGADSVTKTGYITVSALPDAGLISANDDSICSGSAAILDQTGGSGDIQWQQSADGISFTDISGALSGTYNTPTLAESMFYRILATTTCGVDSSISFKLEVLPLPNPLLSAPDTIFCSGDSAEICASGGVSYLWNTDETSTCIHAKSAGGYWLTATDIHGCSNASEHVEMEVYPVPSVSIVVQGDTLSSFNALSYQWYFNGAEITGATDPVYVAQQTGEYSLEITDLNGCKAVSSRTAVVIDGLEELSANSPFILSPNPFHDFIFIYTQSHESALESVEIYNGLGCLVMNESYTGYSSGARILSTSELSTGIYLVKLRAGERQFVKMLVK